MSTPYTFTVTDARGYAVYAGPLWFEAIDTRERFSTFGPPSSPPLTIEGVHPSHEMEPWASTSACAKCQAADGTDGAVLPCGYDLQGRNWTNVVNDERSIAKAQEVADGAPA